MPTRNDLKHFAKRPARTWPDLHLCPSVLDL